MKLHMINRSRFVAWSNLVLLLTAFCTPVSAAVPYTSKQARALVISNVNVFDGERLISKATVVVQDGKIISVGRRARVPDGAEVIDGSGMTVLPGLIDSHSHVHGRHLLRSALMFGVTTNLEMFTTNPQFAAEMRREQADGKASDRSDLYSAGIGVTAPGGHGTRYGVAIPTITDPAQAQAFVDARIAEGSDYIKIILEDGGARGPWPTLTEETLKAVVAAAKRRGKLAVVHVSDESHARMALGAGADGLVHVYWDGRPAADIARLAKSRGSFVIPTLAVIESFMGVPAGESLASDPRVAPYLLDIQFTTLRRKAPKDRKYGPQESYRVAAETVRLLKNAGVSILAGSDCPNPGTVHGVSLHRELELLVQAGLTPKEALMAATSAPAEAFHLKDRGRIKPGLRGDLLLVRGDPTRNILATRDILGVWKEGIAVDREGYRAELQKNKRR